MTSSGERASAESDRSGLPHREVAGGLPCFVPSLSILRGGDAILEFYSVLAQILGRKQGCGRVVRHTGILVGVGPSECDDVIRRAHVSRSRGLPHPSVSSSRFLVAKGGFRTGLAMVGSALWLSSSFTTSRSPRIVAAYIGLEPSLPAALSGSALY